MMFNHERLLDSFLRYVRIDSETKNERAFALALAHELGELGGEVSFDEAGEKLGCSIGNLYCRFAPTKQGEPLLLNAHMDTVKPGISIDPIVEDGIIRTDGSTILGGDDKSGVAAIMETLRTIHEHKIPHAGIEVVFTIHEESGVRGSAELDYNRITAGRALVLDSSGAPGKIITAAPGQSKLFVTVHGKSAHAGVAPEKGISAIQVAAHAIAAMKLLRIDEETTANIGEIHAQFATNIVPDCLTMVAEVRSRNQNKLEAQAQHMLDCVKKSCEEFGAVFEAKNQSFYAGYSLDPKSSFIAAIQDACRLCNLEPVLAASGGGSDANHLNRHGIEAVPLATGMDSVHTTNEKLSIRHLEQITHLVLTLATL